MHQKGGSHAQTLEKSYTDDGWNVAKQRGAMMDDPITDGTNFMIGNSTSGIMTQLATGRGKKAYAGVSSPIPGTKANGRSGKNFQRSRTLSALVGKMPVRDMVRPR